ncbi:hypothetical protein J2Y69_002477 [Microbacterium resistens]|uniref:Uncharacterized protein n=1 Tax=Microbacterium resistens TaxID=156977 RepID=A0ABU1SE45_9MICO|nr:hypothetical protein [Microbacterium resistens]MDR6867869.1 hypothetical protein [Microbacterium resistens]
MSTISAPMVARINDQAPAPAVGEYEREATARAAAQAGMSVAAWIAHTDRLEAAARAHRVADRLMRETPQYRGEDAA